MTLSREMRTRVKIRSSGRALIAASVTGLASFSTGFISTTTSFGLSFSFGSG